MAIQWGIIQNALQSNPGEAFNAGMERGVTRAALGALGQNPNDQRAANALMAFNPQAGFAMQDRQAQQQTAAAQQRRLTAQAQEDEIGNTQNMIIAGASFLEGVQDEAGYQAARQRFLQAFPNAPQPPEQFDPSYVGNVRTTAQQLQAYRASRSGQGGSGGMTTFQRELAGAGILPGSPAYAAAIANRNLPPYDVITPGGRAQQRPGYVDPFSLSGTPQGQQAPGQPQAAQPQASAPANLPPIPQGATPQSLRAMAAEALQAGADPALVLPALTEHLRQMEGGAGPAAAPGDFQPNEFIDEDAAGGW